VEDRRSERAAYALREGTPELAAVRAAHEKQVNELYAEIGGLTTRVAWLKKNVAYFMVGVYKTLSRVERWTRSSPKGSGAP